MVDFTEANSVWRNSEIKRKVRISTKVSKINPQRRPTDKTNIKTIFSSLLFSREQPSTWLEWVEQFAIWFLQFPLVTSSITHYSLSVGGLQQWRPRQLCTTSEEFPLTEFLHLLGATNDSKFRSSISLKINCYYRFSSALEQKQPSRVCSRIEIERLNTRVVWMPELWLRAPSFLWRWCLYIHYCNVLILFNAKVQPQSLSHGVRQVSGQIY